MGGTLGATVENVGLTRCIKTIMRICVIGIRSKFMKKPKSIIVCADNRSRNKGYVCVKGFDSQAARKGISQHCQRCIAESGENNAET